MKGILFKEEMYKAIVEGHKTQTRRIVHQPENSYGLQVCRRATDNAFTGVYAYDEDERTINPGTEQEWQIMPRYKVGETVYLKEPYCRSYIPEIGDKYENPFEATGDPKCWETLYKFDNAIVIDEDGPVKWNNKLFMKAIHARNFIKITGINCERLHAISESDCIAEGIQKFTKEGSIVKEWSITKFGVDGWDWALMFRNAKDAYKYLWITINGLESWNENPFVFLYELELIKK